MRIIHLTIQSNSIQKEKRFYAETLGFKLVDETIDSFTIQVGWSKLTFNASDKIHLYHYCFLIPRNQLCEALAWMEERVDVISIEPGRKIQHFDSWNADSFYFHDASGNIAEMIVRHGLDMESNRPFSINNVLCVNEIGNPTTDIGKTKTYLENAIGLHVWKGDLERFSTLGSEEGLFLLPNYKVKTTRFPTDEKIVTEPHDAVVEVNHIEHQVSYRNGEVVCHHSAQ